MTRGLSQFSFDENGTVPFASGECVIYRAEKSACRAFPDPRDAGLAAGTKRNFQMLPALEFLAEFTQHIPPKGAHLIRYYGWYSNKSRGVRRKAAERLAAAASPVSSCAVEPPPKARCSATWAMLIKRVYEVDPLACPKCGGAMKVLAFIEPPQGSVIERILRHCGLWLEPSPRGPPGEGDCPNFRSTKMGLSPLRDALPTAGDGFFYVPDAEVPEYCEDWDCSVRPSTRRTSESVEPGELTFVDEATFWATF